MDLLFYSSFLVDGVMHSLKEFFICMNPNHVSLICGCLLCKFSSETIIIIIMMCWPVGLQRWFPLDCPRDLCQAVGR